MLRAPGTRRRAMHRGQIRAWARMQRRASTLQRTPLPRGRARTRRRRRRAMPQPTTRPRPQTREHLERILESRAPMRRRLHAALLGLPAARATSATLPGSGALPARASRAATREHRAAARRATPAISASPSEASLSARLADNQGSLVAQRSLHARGVAIQSRVTASAGALAGERVSPEAPAQARAPILAMRVGSARASSAATSPSRVVAPLAAQA
jgi:hypothetical protein